MGQVYRPWQERYHNCRIKWKVFDQSDTEKIPDEHQGGLQTFKQAIENYLRQMYKTNAETNGFIIEVSVDSYNEIFNGWDPSPVKRRDLDPEVMAFIESCSADIPLRYPVELHFYLPAESRDEEKERLSEEGIRNNFSYSIALLRRSLADIRRKTMIYAVAAFAFLTLRYMPKPGVPANLLTTILTEGLSIGGWVFLWEAFSLFFFSGQETSGQLKRYLRLLNAKIAFKYR